MSGDEFSICHSYHQWGEFSNSRKGLNACIGFIHMMTPVYFNTPLSVSYWCIQGHRGQLAGG